MTPESPEDDRTVIRPPAPPATVAPVPPQAGQEHTQRVQMPPSAAADHDMGNGLPLATRLGEFELIKLLGEGGFGIVYLATDHSLGRRVALKEYMPSALAARTGGSQVQVKSERYRETFDAGLKSFINEARLLASFDHPSLVKVYRFWEANGTAYMVMPYYEGKNLRDTLRTMGQAPDEAWLRTLLIPLTEALAVIHAEQCYHRDIAPDNVMMLAGSNRPLLLDFGAARRVIGDMTQALTVILKPGYAPVEQYAEIPGMKQGPWTDVYALAAVVHYAIMGKTPPPSVGRLLNDTYVPLVQAAQGRYSERFLAAIDRGLAVRPEERTQSIGELRSDLGLGEIVFDPYTTQPLPPGTEPALTRTQSAPRPPSAAPATAAYTGFQPTAVYAPKPTPAAGTRPAPVPPSAPQAPAAKKPNTALIGAGAGVVALAAVGIGAYLMLAPKASPPEPVVAAAPVPAPPPAPVPVTPVVTPAPAAPQPARFDPGREFERIVQAQTPGFELRAQAPKTELRVGRDEVKFRVSSEREGFVYVFGLSSDGLLALLVPNERSGTVRLRKGQTYSFPTGDGFYLPADEPLGRSQLLVMVSSRQRDFEAMRPKAESLIRLFPTGDEAAALAALHRGPNSALAGRAVCPANSACEDDYGAALLNFDTVR